MTAAIRRIAGEKIIVGMRISGDEKDYAGLQDSEAMEAMQALEGTLDYYNIVVGSSASFGGAVHIAAPMAFEHAYVAPFARRGQGAGEDADFRRRAHQPSRRKPSGFSPPVAPISAA